ncbi:hypothetical protein V3C99_014997 [Haemonchus contortus]
MDDCRNTAEAAVRSQERVLQMDQDKENVQGSEVRDVVGEIQKLQEKQAKDMMRNDEEMSDEDMEDDDANVRAVPRASGDWSSLRAALENAFGAMGKSGGANRNRCELHG